ncbi:MAG: hypothetical protein EXR70_05790 [Deltaproteobacteria bacterium]|nr:hypothetical protein [Deltaproteobacteria bacterium]
MSGIVGIINLDGAPVDPALLQKLTGSMAYRGPDRQQTWLDGHVGFVPAITTNCCTPSTHPRFGCWAITIAMN